MCFILNESPVRIHKKTNDSLLLFKHSELFKVSMYVPLLNTFNDNGIILIECKKVEMGKHLLYSHSQFISFQRLLFHAKHVPIFCTAKAHIP
jgi:hypothetical protein